jgi:DNA-binding transcriptional MerR regulator/methylmalonyl-CoA mutase cobalamin-binding subunit
MPSSTTPRFPIRVAAQRGGVSVAALRAWERRHQAVSPARTQGEQRLYSDADVERIAMLQALTSAGHAIAGIADADDAELRRLVSATVPEEAADAETPRPTRKDDAPALLVVRCMRAVHTHDGDALLHLLRREAIRTTPLAFLEHVVAPLLRRVGDEWAEGRLSEAQERVASNAVANLLVSLLGSLGLHPSERTEKDPRTRVLIATLSGEGHEAGALMAGVVAALAGCDVIRAGADLPASAIASAARRARASVVAVSIVDATGPKVAQRELIALRALLPARTRLVVGGAAASLLDQAIEAIGAERYESLEAWRAALAH